MTPEQEQHLFQFVNLIAEGVAAKIAEKQAATPPPPPAQAGPRPVEVTRTDDDGEKRREINTLPDLIAELCDNVRVQTLATELLIQALNDNARVNKRLIDATKQTLKKE